MASDLIGQVIGKYRVVRLLGEGGMGVVFEGARDDIGSRAAVKLLHVELARNTEIATRFFNELRSKNSRREAMISLHQGMGWESVR